MKIKFDTDLPRHSDCYSWEEGDKIFFKCKECTFLREMDLKTNNTKILIEGDVTVLHQGSHQNVKSIQNTSNEN